MALRHVLIMERPRGIWVARWLEHDIVGQGTTPEVAFRNMKLAIEMHEQIDRAEHREPFSDIPPSDDFYREVYEKRAEEWESAEQPKPQKPSGIRIGRMEHSAQL